MQQRDQSFGWDGRGKEIQKDETRVHMYRPFHKNPHLSIANILQNNIPIFMCENTESQYSLSKFLSGVNDALL